MSLLISSINLPTEALAVDIPVLVVPVRFADISPESTVAEIDAWVRGEVAGYIREVSFGTFELDVRTLGARDDTWFAIPGVQADYGAGGRGTEVPIRLAIDALYAADVACDTDPDALAGAIDWPRFDQTAPPYPAILVVHAGHADRRNNDSIHDWAVHLGARESFWKPPPSPTIPAGTPADWLARGYPWPVPDDIGQSRTVTVAILSETRVGAFEDGSLYYESGLGSYAHELMHAIGWLPDLYDLYSGFSDVLGVELLSIDDDFTARWALLGNGDTNPSAPYGLRGSVGTFNPSEFESRPAYPIGYSQIQLGLLDDADRDVVRIVRRPPLGGSTNSASLVLQPLEDDPSTPCPEVGLDCVRVIKIPVSSDGRLYYLIEARKWQGSDEGLPDQGVLIATVDESRSPGRGIVRIVDDTPLEPIDDPGLMVRNALNPLDDATWKAPQVFAPDSVAGLTVSIAEDLGDGYHRIEIVYPPSPQPDVEITPWGAPDPPPYKTVDVWIDSRIELEGGLLLNDWDEYANPDPLGNRDPLWLDHLNRVHVRLRNLGEGPAEDVEVRVSWAPFGAGQSPSDWQFLDQTTVDLGAAGGPDAERVVVLDWTPDSSALGAGQHFCLLAELSCAGDLNPGNQQAQENVTDEYAESPVEHGFQITNPGPQPARFFLQVDRSSLPGDWAVELEEYEFVLGPGERRGLQVTVVPPTVSEPVMRTVSVRVSTDAGDVAPVPLGGISLDVYARPSSTVQLLEPVVTRGRVIVNGFLRPERADVPVILRYVRPDGTSWVRGVRTRDDGQFSDRIEDATTGTWRVAATWPGDYAYRPSECPPVPFTVSGRPTLVVVVTVAVLLFVAVFVFNRIRRSRSQ
ncbi:metallopeptidase domain-containing protein [Tautonia rosea]|uniref:hypothetical protein n=1 Tax=Tautonia rosea TaxID=2728037 RepID=UPI001473F06D|nr:hypothetical protein [Tautonia rosea]